MAYPVGITDDFPRSCAVIERKRVREIPLRLFQQRIPLGQLGALIRNAHALPHDLRVRVLDDFAQPLNLARIGVGVCLLDTGKAGRISAQVHHA
jgi:hypothetical protein